MAGVREHRHVADLYLSDFTDDDVRAEVDVQRTFDICARVPALTTWYRAPTARDVLESNAAHGSFSNFKGNPGHDSFTFDATWAIASKDATAIADLQLRQRRRHDFDRPGDHGAVVRSDD